MAPHLAMIGDLVAGAFAGLAVAMPIGAVGAYLVSLASRERYRVAAAAAMGVASVDGGYAVLAAVGGAGLRTVVERIADVLTVLAAAVLAAVAAWTVQSAVRRFRSGPGTVGGDTRRLTPGRAYLTLIGMTAVNPATVITFTAVVLGLSAGESRTGWATVVLFALGAFTTSAAWQLLLTGGGSLLGKVVGGRRGQLGIAIGSAAIMLGLAVAVLFR